MRLIITEHTLFGELRPWLTDDVDIKAVSGTFEQSLTWTEGKKMLEHYPELRETVASQWGLKEAESQQAVHFVQATTDEPFNKKTSFYYKLITFEHDMVLRRLTSQVRDLEKDVDRVYKVNTTLRYLVDLLGNIRESLGGQDAKETAYLASLIRKQLMRLILDLGARYEHLSGVEQYSEQELFTMILNRPAPKEPTIYKTADYWESRLEVVLKDSAKRSDVVALHGDIFTELKTASDIVGGRRRLKQRFSAIIAHLENALLLLEMEASFLNENRGQLADARYCREWVQGIRQELLEEGDPERMSELLKKIVDTTEKLKPLFVDTDKEAEQWLSYPSEARQLCSATESISKSSFVVGLSADPTKGRNAEESTGNFAASFNERFMSLEEFDSVFPGRREATMRYIKDGNLRVVEVSREVKLLYREDVERFLEERTKRY